MPPQSTSIDKYSLKMKYVHVDIQTSMALVQETRGTDCCEADSCVVIVKTVVTPKEIRAGTESLLIQKLTHERTTISVEGMYVCKRQKPISLPNVNETCKHVKAPEKLNTTLFSRLRFFLGVRLVHLEMHVCQHTHRLQTYIH